MLQNRPQTLQHGDYHVGNMVISDHGELSIIDFNRYDYGDPWEEFNRIVTVSENRHDRHQSFVEFQLAWKKALAK